MEYNRIYIVPPSQELKDYLFKTIESGDEFTKLWEDAEFEDWHWFGNLKLTVYYRSRLMELDIGLIVLDSWCTPTLEDIGTVKIISSKAIDETTLRFKDCVLAQMQVMSGVDHFEDFMFLKDLTEKCSDYPKSYKEFAILDGGNVVCAENIGTYNKGGSIEFYIHESPINSISLDLIKQTYNCATLVTDGNFIAVDCLEFKQKVGGLLCKGEISFIC